MIKIKAIVTDKGSIKPEENPFTKFGSHCDGEYFYFFESDKEKKDFYNSLPILEEFKSREVALWKVRAILKQMGLIPSIETALNSLPENVKDIALSAWEYSATINQYSPTVKLIQQTCNLTDVQMEDIFNNAEKINI